MITQEGNSPTARPTRRPPTDTPGAGSRHHSIVKAHSHAWVLGPHPATPAGVGKETPSPTLPYCAGCGCVCGRTRRPNTHLRRPGPEVRTQPAPAGRSPTPAFRGRSPSSFSPPGRPLPRCAHARPPGDPLPPGPLTLVISRPLPRVLESPAQEGRQEIPGRTRLWPRAGDLRSRSRPDRPL